MKRKPHGRTIESGGPLSPCFLRPKSEKSDNAARQSFLPSFDPQSLSIKKLLSYKELFQVELFMIYSFPNTKNIFRSLQSTPTTPNRNVVPLQRRSQSLRHSSPFRRKFATINEQMESCTTTSLVSN